MLCDNARDMTLNFGQGKKNLKLDGIFLIIYIQISSYMLRTFISHIPDYCFPQENVTLCSCYQSPGKVQHLKPIS